MGKYVESEKNQSRADWAQTALNAFENTCMAGAGEDTQTIMGDLVCNLMHLCAQNNIKWADVLATSEGHFEEERDGKE